ncbi:17103_t:CDS:2 [Gigaspora rosea]|nr:17103_t:CDS:2 [Gigaspora rosea]
MKLSLLHLEHIIEKFIIWSRLETQLFDEANEPDLERAAPMKITPKISLIVADAKK